MLPSNTPPGSAIYRRRDSETQAIAVVVRQSNLQQIAAWVGGDVTGVEVSIPSPGIIEHHAAPGDYVVARPDGWWSVWSDAHFNRHWTFIENDK